MSRVFIILGSVNTHICLQNALGMPIAWLSKQTKGLKNGVIHDSLLFNQFLNELILEIEIDGKSKVTDVILGLYGNFMHADVVNFSLSYEQPQVLDSTFTKKFNQWCKNWCSDRKRYFLSHEFLEIIVDGNIVYDFEGLKVQELKMTFNIFSANILQMDNLLESSKRSYLNIIDIVPLPLIMKQSIDNMDIKDLGMLCIDIGGESTTITSIYMNKTLFVEQLPMGGSFLTRALAQNLNTSIEEAERIKCIYGAAMSTEQDAYEWLEVPLLSGKMLCVNKIHIIEFIANYMQVLMGRVLTILKNKSIPANLYSRVMLTGNGTKLQRMNLLVEQSLKAEVLYSTFLNRKYYALETLMDMYRLDFKKTGWWKKLIQFFIPR